MGLSGAPLGAVHLVAHETDCVPVPPLAGRSAGPLCAASPAEQPVCRMPCLASLQPPGPSSHMGRSLGRPERVGSLAPAFTSVFSLSVSPADGHGRRGFGIGHCPQFPAPWFLPAYPNRRSYSARPVSGISRLMPSPVLPSLLAPCRPPSQHRFPQLRMPDCDAGSVPRLHVISVSGISS
jgi:hypothetical protein